MNPFFIVINSEDKKVFFLANTIPLVNQQAAFIARNSSFKVRHLTGDMEVDYWTQEKWEVVIGEFNVRNNF
jgi:endoribonuclease Dicer